MTDLPPKKAIPYDDLLALVYRLEQRVNDLTAQLAQHEAAPYPHVRYDMRAIGHIVLDGLAPLDYDIDAQMDTPITDDAQAAACELTAEQRARIWQRVQAQTNGDGSHAA